MAAQLFPAAACVQLAIRPGQLEENLRSLERQLEAAAPAPHTLLVLPELWATGFDYPQTLAAARQAPRILAALERIARERQLYLAGSLGEVMEPGGRPHNNLVVVGPEGLVGRFAKQHLFAAWQEDRHYQPGLQATPLETPLGRLGGLVCHDLRFPEQAREQAAAGAEILIVSAQWPGFRLDHWRILVQARAVENQLYVIAANGCGPSGELELAGHSMIVAPDGTILDEGGSGPQLVAAALSRERQQRVRRRFCPPGERPWQRQDQAKVRSLAQVEQDLKALRRQGSRVAFTNGCFDILHAGHVHYLEQARACGDCLVVGLNSDRSIREIKGPSRPVNREEDRARVLAALGCVDYVVLFAEPTPLQLITTLLPDILVKGADWAEDQIVGGPEVKAAGGRIERIAFSYDRSTTGVIEKIQQQLCS
ncbi:D-glycero-beta-D-manno-heptose 1-phosphate adenylyltransferase [Desulfogranum mediterraneum]|uniref:D-glycero-beta-D-manno-heptose 1-phosphate adenylyltransferase n=1 Tax=Desulfogranum mediterraneum TaxID=160661 RepID=UPI000409C486|nr:D-glycero-beta-D-manno-heptose 1-phosphate adenylyltransferase [Desulfogranum mediterraneum]